ncbi:MBL fold metallo-hydrolase [Enterovirga rhinocerotis]|uniref:MBL fold metallo-hydrolase n=1 Tax=Enterovirga rhinocerotis TaxID=1339210 RepID=UPI00105B4969|nr:MBL fold metallo-hydrolase [Enterovirga rhinocerotis]
MNRRSLGRIASAAAVLTMGGVGYAAMARSRNPYYQGAVSDHFDGIRFHRPGVATEKGMLELARWQMGRGRASWPPRFPSSFADKPPERVQGLRVVLVGHATLLIQVAGLNILTDPIWSERASPLRFAGPRRVNPPGIAFADLPPIDAVLVTHNHYDHLDVATIGRLWERDQPTIVTPLGNDAIIRAHEDEAAVDTLDWGGSVTLGEGVEAHLLPCNHWSARGINDRRMALWGAFVLTTPAGTLYLAGDTGYGDGDIFRAVPERFGPPRLACLPIGAYEPRWFMEAQHMNPSDAVKAFADLGAEQAIGIHWGTFQLTNEPVDQPEIDLAAALAEAGIAPERFPAFRPGQVWEPAGTAAG